MPQGNSSKLKCAAVFAGAVASVYNGMIIYWYVIDLQNVSPSSDLALVLQILLEVLISLAAVHIAISGLLINGIIKEKPDLVMLWVVMYSSSCTVVSSMFTVGLAVLAKTSYLYIVLCNVIFIPFITITHNHYKEMIIKLSSQK